MIIYNLEENQWQSCISISNNLRKAYQLTNLDIVWHGVTNSYFNELTSENLFHIHKEIEEALNQNPQTIILLDHTPCQATLLSLFLASPKINKIKPNFIVHLYGDFTLKAQQWANLSKALTGYNIKFICASKRQVDLFASFLPNKVESVFLCPFPVDTDFFKFDLDQRNKKRAELHLKEHDKAIIYTGRISLQKNVDILLDEFSYLVKKNKQIKRLFIIGDYDDLGGPTLGIFTKPGWTYQKIDKTLRSLPIDVQNKIVVLNSISHNELLKFLVASDLFWSLSLYHDEDFGMSPAEALSCGMPASITDWGGYSSFKHEGINCKLARVDTEMTHYQINISQFRKNNIPLLKEISINDRNRQHNKFEKIFGILAVSEALIRISNAKYVKFRGFNRGINDLAFTLKKSEILPEPLRKKIYKNYTG